MITDEQVREALEANATKDGEHWGFRGSVATHTEASALAITRACLILGMPVDDVLTGEAWGKVVAQLAQMAERVTALEASRGA